MTDRAFEELQRRCRKLRHRKIWKWILIFVVFAGVLAVMVFKIYLDKPIKKVIVVKKIVSKPVAPKKILPKKQIKIPKKKPAKEDTYDTIILKPTIIIPKVKDSKNKDTKIVKKEIKKPIKAKIPVKNQEQKINIKVTSLKDEQSLLKDNKTNEDFTSTLNLAKYYYDHSKYGKAIFFAKKANRYKPSSFIPWQYYAKAKIKQNKKADAIDAIRQYLSYFDSDVAQKMLAEIGDKK
jgi:hypothetical protein